MLLFCMIQMEPADITRFEEIYKKYEQSLITYTLPKVNYHYELAEDAVAEAFSGLSRHMEIVKKRDVSILEAYLFTSAKNAACKIMHEEHRLEMAEKEYEAQFQELLDTNLDVTLNELCTRESMNIVQEEIEKLPYLYRDLFYLHYLCHISLREIAKQVHSNYSTVRKRNERGKKMLILKLLERGILPHDRSSTL